MFQGFAMDAWLSLKINQWWIIILAHTHISMHTKSYPRSLLSNRNTNAVSFLVQAERKSPEAPCWVWELTSHLLLGQQHRNGPWGHGWGFADIHKLLLFLLLSTFLLIFSFPPSLSLFLLPSSPAPLSLSLISPAVFSPWNLTFFLPEEVSNLSTHGHLWRFYYCSKLRNCQQGEETQALICRNSDYSSFSQLGKILPLQETSDNVRRHFLFLWLGVVLLELAGRG